MSALVMDDRATGIDHLVTVLVVDDDVDHRILLRMRLAGIGVHVIDAASGEEALERLDGVDLVLCDYRLPGIDGLETLAAIRRRGGPSVIIVTGMGSESVAGEALRSGAIDYVVKDANYLNSVPAIVQRAWRHHDLARRADELQRLAILVASATGRGELLGEIVCGARRLLRAAGCALYVVRNGTTQLELVDGDVPDLDEVEHVVRRRLGVGIARAVSSSAVVVPLPAQSGPVGALVFSAPHGGAFPASELRLAETFASFAGLALFNLDRLVERTAALRRLAVSEERFRQAFDNAPIGMALLALDRGAPGRIIELNQALCAITGFDAATLAGMSITALVHPDDRDIEAAQLGALAAGATTTARFERRYQRVDGQTVWVEGSVSVVNAPDGESLYAILQVEDVTGRRAAEERLQALALHDSVTGLPNRVLFSDRLEQALRQRRDGDGDVAVLFVDLDRFKHVNDVWGHHIGDALLCEVGRRIREVVRPADTAARLGGDEFVVLCEGVDRAAALALGERIAAAVAVPCALGEGVDVAVTASIGVAVVGEVSPQAVLRMADTAMYRAKSRGKARVDVFDDALGAAAVGRVRLEEELRGALAGGELVVRYQPAFSVASGAIVGVEALACWAHPERGLLTAESFINVAEESGLIGPLGELVLRTACRAASRWASMLPTPVPVWVNVSGRQAASGQLDALVGEVLADTGLAPHLLCVELTESVLLDASSMVVSDFRALRNRGVSVAIDDFGTGYASMSYLTQFPVDVLKIDRSFLRGVMTDDHAAAIVEAVIRLGRSLGLVVVAEGVETGDQLDWLRTLDCDVAQGFFLARPGDVDEVSVLLSALAARLPTAASRS